MSAIAEEYRNWLARYPKEPADRLALALAAIDNFERCEGRSDVPPEDLRPLVDAAASPHKLVFETGAYFLAKLAETSAAAQQCLLQMSQDKNATARFHAVAYLNSRLPEALRLEIVTRAVDDKSAKVRSKAAERAEQFRFKQLLPRLEGLLRTETNAGVRQSLELHIPLLRDGYWLRPFGDDGYQLSVSCADGSLASIFIPREKCTDEFVRKEIARLRKMWA